QKYVIIQDVKKHTLVIKEFAVIEKNLTNTQTSMLRPEDYSFLHEEVYDGPIIESSISDGKKSLVSVLRTPSFFPAERNAAKIADSVIQLMNSKRDRSLEVFIDDQERKGKNSKEKNADLDNPIEHHALDGEAVSV
nr:hypothetical protein [Desulfobacterales bacterium]